MTCRDLRPGRGLLLLAACGLAWTGGAGAQGVAGPELPGLEQELTGGSSRAWTETGRADGMTGCGTPDTLTFDTGHRVVIARCRGGRVRLEAQSWRLEAQSLPLHEGGMRLRIGSAEAEGVTRPAGGPRRLLLRRLVPGGMGDTVELRAMED